MCKELATTYLTFGRVEDAQRAAEEAVAIHEAIYGSHHWEVDFDEHLYAVVLHSMTDAEAFQRERARLRLLRGEIEAITGVLPEPPANLAPLLVNDFDRPVLDGAWTVRYVEASGWTHALEGSRLVVSNIAPDAPGSEGGRGREVAVKLGQRVAPTGDFRLSARIGWDSGQATDVMAKLFIRAIGEQGVVPAEIGFNDAWADWNGQVRVDIANEVAVLTGADTLAAQGEAIVELCRTGDHIVAIWDGKAIATGECAAAVHSVTIRFGHHWGVVHGRRTSMGSVWIDHLRFEGAPP